jgi:hypothetical protein
VPDLLSRPAWHERRNPLEGARAQPAASCRPAAVYRHDDAGRRSDRAHASSRLGDVDLREALTPRSPPYGSRAPHRRVPQDGADVRVRASLGRPGRRSGTRLCSAMLSALRAGTEEVYKEYERATRNHLRPSTWGCGASRSYARKCTSARPFVSTRRIPGSHSWSTRGNAGKACVVVESEPRQRARTLAWWAGAILQGVVLGGGLALALLQLMEVASGAQIFRYQGF